MTANRRIGTAGVLGLLAVSAWADPVSNAFTYQGQLMNAGELANGTFNLSFTLWDAVGAGNPPVGGSLIGGPDNEPGTQVSDGLFTVQLNDAGQFGGGAFNGAARWVQVAVNGTVLGPRQPLTATPYALQTRGILVDDSGKVGIGSSAAPDAELFIDGSGSSDISVHIHHPGATTGDIYIGSPVGAIGFTAFAPTNGHRRDIRFSDAGLGLFTTSGTGHPGNGLFIDEAGSVGINTTAPGQLLDVAGRIRVQQNIPAASGNTAGIWLYQQNPAEDRAFIGMRNDNQIGLYGNNGASWGLVMDVASGNVGVGTTNPVAKLYALNSEGTQSALHCAQASTGTAAAISIINGDSTASAVNATTLGRGRAGSFSIINSSSTASALYCTTSGDGLAFQSNGKARIDTGETGAALTVTSPYACHGDPDGFWGCDGVAINTVGAILSNHWIVGGLKAFQIDHPLDPANRYLMHACIESDEMKNLYDGIVVLDQNGDATVQLPDWFEALNHEFRYQLTCVGGFAQVYVAEEIRDGRFKIAGGRSGLKVSWQVSGVRKDAFAQAYRVPVEPLKAEHERGRFLHPELYGQPAERGISHSNRPVTE